MPKKESVTIHIPWVLTCIVMLATTMGSFYTLRANANTAYSIAVDTKERFEKHCKVALDTQQLQSDALHKIETNTAIIETKLKFIEVYIQENNSFQQALLEELKRLRKK